jgi:hypothetical protein
MPNDRIDFSQLTDDQVDALHLAVFGEEKTLGMNTDRRKHELVSRSKFPAMRTRIRNKMKDLGFWKKGSKHVEQQTGSN